MQMTYCDVSMGLVGFASGHLLKVLQVWRNALSCFYNALQGDYLQHNIYRICISCTVCH